MRARATCVSVPEQPVPVLAALAPPLAHAITQLVESVAEAHFTMHWPHGAFLPMSAITAPIVSAAVPTPITSDIVHTAAGGAGGGGEVGRRGAGVAAWTGAAFVAAGAAAPAEQQLRGQFESM